MTSGRPERVSVIIPVYNGARYLAEAIGSALTQSAPAAEVIVVDDGSTDGSAEIARSFGEPVRVITQSNRGPGAARNAGVAQARGGLLAFLDADDLWRAEKLSRQLEWLRADAGLAFVFTHVRNFLSPDLEPPPEVGEANSARSMPGVIPSSLLVRREAFERCGPFPEDLALGELVPWLGRARDLGLRSHTLAEVLVDRRIHWNNLGRTKASQRSAYVMAVKLMLDRRRRPS